MLGMLGCRSGIIFSKPQTESNYYSMCFFGCEKFRFLHDTFHWWLSLKQRSGLSWQRENRDFGSFFKKILEDIVPFLWDH